MKTLITPGNLVLLSLVGAALAGCATKVGTPGGEVTCYSSRCVEEMRAWSQQAYRQRQYEEEQARRASAKTPAPPVRAKPAPAPAPVKAPPARQTPPQVPCPAGMPPNGPPDNRCIYPRR